MGIGTLNEKPLHAALKAHFRLPGSKEEVPIDGFVADIVHGDELIEIQTQNFAAMHRKFDVLLDRYRIRLVFPVAKRKWIVKLDARGEVTSRRASSKRGKPIDVCSELVAFPSLLSHPNFRLVVALIHEEEVLRPGRSRRRRGFVLDERRLLSVESTVTLASPQDLQALVPRNVPEPFTTAHLAAAIGRTRHVAQEVAFCLRVSGAADVVGRDRRGMLYSLSESVPLTV